MNDERFLFQFKVYSSELRFAVFTGLVVCDVIDSVRLAGGYMVRAFRTELTFSH